MPKLESSARLRKLIMGVCVEEGWAKAMGSLDRISLMMRAIRS